MDKMDKMDKARRILTGSASSAFAALLMVGAITLGSTVIRPMTVNHEPEATTAQADDGAAGNDGGTDGGVIKPSDGDKPDKDFHDYWKPAYQPKEEPKEEPADEPKEEPKAEPKDQPKDEPKDQPKDEPKPDPAPSSALTLEAFYNADKGKIVVKWSAYTGEFEKYKLVRSSDGTVTWPEGEGDMLVGVIGPDGNYFVDTDAPCNDEVHYRVFAVRHGEEGYVVLASSNVDGALRECSETPPADPVALAFQVGQAAEGVKLAWEPCTSDAFVVYKVVRSATNASPVYPLNDGTELIGVIENAGVTGFVDSNVEAGQTWTYRVLCMGQNGGGWYVIGQTSAESLTVE
jgi:hypothetical protein